MDLNAILNSIAEFFSTDFGAAVGNALNAIYKFLYPANAEGAWDVPLPDTSPRK